MTDLLQLQSILLEMSWILSTKGIHARHRAVTFNVDQEDRIIHVYFYFDGEFSKLDIADVETSVDVVKKSIEKNTVIQDFRCIAHLQRLDYPSKIPPGYFVYLRDESSFKSSRPVPVTIDHRIYCSQNISDLDALSLLLMYSLLGKVRPRLRYVGCSLHEHKKIAYFFIYFDGEISTDDEAHAQKIVDCAVTFFKGSYVTKTTTEQIDYPKPVPRLGTTIYERNESVFSYKCTISPKTWVNVKDLSSNTSAIQNDEFDLLLSNFRINLLGEIRPNWKAVQFTVNRLHKKGHCWFHYAGGSGEVITRVAEKFKRTATKWGFDFELSVECIKDGAPIPRYGHFLFMRDDPALCVAVHNITNYKTVREFVTAQIPAIWKQNVLRAVLIDAHESDKKIYVYFVYNEPVRDEEATNARTLIKILKDAVFQGYSSEGFFAHYHHFESIPKIGYPAYLDAEEKTLEHIFLNMDLPEALAGNVIQQLISVKVNIDFINKVAYYWFYYEDSYQLSSGEKIKITKVMAESTPLGYESKAEISFLKSLEREPSIGWFVYRRYVDDIKER